MMMVVMTMSSLCVTPISTWGLVSCLLVSTVAAVFTLVATIGHSLHLVRDLCIYTSAVKRSIGSTTGCTITEMAPTRAFSLLKAPTSAFTFKTLLRNYAKHTLTLQ